MKITPDDPRLTDYVLGELSAEDAVAVDRAAAADPAIRLSLNELERTMSWLGETLALQAEMKATIRTGPQGNPVLTREFALRPNGRVLGEVSGELIPGRYTFATGTTQPLEAEMVPEAFASLMQMLSKDPERPALTIDQPMDVRIWLREGERPNSIATDPERHEAVDFAYTPYPVEFILMAPYPQ